MTDPPGRPGVLPERGLDDDELLATLDEMRAGDADWRTGRTFGMVFDAGPATRDVVDRVALRFLHENALNTHAVPSLGRIQSDVCAITADLLHGATAAGFLTSGGTESILVAVKAARDRARAERGVTEPEMVLPVSAHAAFHKAAHLFGLTVRATPVDDDLRADVDAVADAVSDRTVLVVGSAPGYPHGVIDPIPELAALAADVGAGFHTDACMGGFVLPFAERLGEDVPPWDFRVEGVTSISADLHKLGYAPKGVSVILHRTKELRRYQTFVFDDWLGGFYASPNLQGSRPGGPMATGWAVLHHLGMEGYLRLTADTLAAARRIREGIAAIDGLAVVGDPRWHLHAFTGGETNEPGSSARRGSEAGGVGGTSEPVDIDPFAVGDEMARRGGWHHDRQTPPDALHVTVSAGNVAVVDDYLTDLADSVAAVRAGGAVGRATPYSTAG